jgi:hypothetical protein
MPGFRIGVLTSLALAAAFVVALYALAPAIDRERIAADDASAITSAIDGYQDYPFVRVSNDLRGQIGALSYARPSGASVLDSIERIGARIRLLAIAILGSVVLFWGGILAKDKLQPPSRAYNNVVALLIVGSVALPLWASQNLYALLLVLPSALGLVAGMVAARRAPRPARVV